MWKCSGAWLRRRAVNRWPVTPATFTKGHIQFVYAGDGNVPQVQMWFTYRVSGETLAGYYEEIFQQVQDAERLLTSLADGPLYVRYNLSNPIDYHMDPYRDVGP